MHLSNDFYLIRYDLTDKNIIISSILLSGLVNISLYSTVASAETTTTKTNHVIAGDTQQYRIYEGLAPTMQLGKRHANKSNARYI
jgi:hypothetical protein